MKKLDITALIEKAETLVYDGRLDMAASGKIVIQEIELENGNKYTLSITAEIIENELQEG